MRFFAALVSFQLAFASSSVASEPCVMPLIGSDPILDVEKQQPSRMARTPVSIPGYDGLVVKAFNRHELREVDGHIYRKIDDEFPHVWGGAYQRNIRILPNGDAVGFGFRPRRIYELRVGTSDWLPVPGTDGYRRPVFDEVSGDLYFQNDTGKFLLRQANGDRTETGPMPSYDGEDFPISAIRTVPELYGTLALFASRRNSRRWTHTLWFRPVNGEWMPIPVDLPEGQVLPSDFGVIEVDEANQLLRLFHDGDTSPPLFFRIENGLPVFAAAAPAGKWAFHPESGAWIGWSGSSWQRLSERFLLFFKVGVSPKPPVAYAVQPGDFAARKLEGLEPRSSIIGDRISYFLTAAHIGETGPILIRASDGLVAFDGKTVRQLPSLTDERVGGHLWVRKMGGKTFGQSKKGVFLLNGDLVAERIDSFPVTKPWFSQVSINYLPGVRRFVVVDRKTTNIYESSDMRDFTRIDTEAEIIEFVAALPDRVGALLVGTDKLYTLEAQCPVTAE